VRALVFRKDLARLAVAGALGPLTPRAFVSRAGPLRLEEVPEPEPIDGWVRCRTQVTGICGSDAKQIFLDGARDNPLTALISFPHILGHEAVAVREHDSARVAVDPWLGCIPRGVEPCRACREGNHPGCRNFTRGRLAPGIHLGNCADAGGTHADLFCAHESQLYEVPNDLPDAAAVLADPVSVSLHSILKRIPDPELPALVYGCGTLGLCAIALLRHLYTDLEIFAVSKGGRPADLARELGADVVIVGSPDAIVETIAKRMDVPMLSPWSHKPWLQDGPGVVYDTVGTPETIETSLRMLATRGSLVVSGVATPARFEWTPLYFKEIEIVGSNAFGIETLRGERKHAFLHYFDLVRTGFDATPIITHRFPLERWDEAILTIADRHRTGAIKVLLEP
jgi:threonine dehydrogenase-like Zn-dependent dehydrogenase